jgi:hypothetical protein
MSDYDKVSQNPTVHMQAIRKIMATVSLLRCETSTAMQCVTPQMTTSVNSHRREKLNLTYRFGFKSYGLKCAARVHLRG